VSDEAAARPANGVRLVVKLDPTATTEGVYTLAAGALEGEWQGTATVGVEGGTVAFSGWVGGEPPSWVLAALRALLRLAWQRRRAGEPWPRRLSRWRPAPSTAEST
jgi:hypothetical protein